MPTENAVKVGRRGTVRRTRADRFDRWQARGLAALVVSTLVYVFSHTVADADLWGHIRFGQDLWETGQVVRPDAYSYLSGAQVWINHEWLAEAIFAGLYDFAGPTALVLLKVLITLLIAGLLYGHLRRRGLAPVRAWSLILVPSFLLWLGLATVRPHMFTYIGLLLFLLIIYQADRGRVGWLWALPPLVAVWVNLHGGFLAGVGILLLWALASLACGLVETRSLSCLRARHHRTVILVVAATLIATLLNPYGIDLILFLLRTATVPRPEIMEWLPLNIASQEGVFYLVTVFLAIAGFLFSSRKRSPSLVFLFVGMALLALANVRHLPLFALTTLVTAGEHIGSAWQRLWARPGERKTKRPRASWEAGLVGLCLLASVVFMVRSIPNWSCIRVYLRDYPFRAVALLDGAANRHNMAVHFRWGEYAIWHLGPSIQVSVDGRRETVYDEEVYRQNLDFMYGVGDWDALLTEHETELALVMKGSPTHNLLALKPGWLIAYEDETGVIAVQEGSPLIQQIREAQLPPDPQSDYVCFPGVRGAGQ